MKKTLLRSLITLLVLFQVFVVALYLRRDDTPLRCLVSVNEQAYYVLPIKGGDTLFLPSPPTLTLSVVCATAWFCSAHSTPNAKRHNTP